jgi:D-3-phosphoglycerate dehydrogenase / 2-oxoglutarate reductase
VIVTRTVVALGHRFPDVDIERTALGMRAHVVDGNATGVDVDAALSRADVVLLGTQATLDAATLQRMPRCAIVVRYGIGADNVDQVAARELGIAVANVPDYCLDEVSDHTLAFVLLAARRLDAARDAARSGHWGTAAMQGTRRLSTQTLGLIGYGRIGQLVARKAQAFGMRVIVHDPYIEPAALRDDGCEPSELDALVASADVVSLHCPLTPATANVIDAARLAQMRPHAWLVNTSRGGLVDLDALLAALDAGTIAGAAVDVLPDEPVPANHPAVTHPKLVLTPHVAWFSSDAVSDLRRRAAEIAGDALDGTLPGSTLNGVDAATLRARLAA